VRKASSLTATVLLGAVTLGLLPETAAAQYLDPGAGSIMVQAVIAVAIGLAATLRLYWHRISGFLASRRSKNEGEQR
jgi:hypothetical protein